MFPKQFSNDSIFRKENSTQVNVSLRKYYPWQRTIYQTTLLNFFVSQHELLEKRKYLIHFPRCDTDPYWYGTTLHLRKEVITIDIFKNTWIADKTAIKNVWRYKWMKC